MYIKIWLGIERDLKEKIRLADHHQSGIRAKIKKKFTFFSKPF